VGYIPELEDAMRIPVNSCEGCNHDAPLKSSGVHAMGDGRYMRCAFVSAELFGWNPPIEMFGAYRTRSAAIRQAKKHNGGILWVGQSPASIWLAVK
jgi:hypothetical protein